MDDGAEGGLAPGLTHCRVRDGAEEADVQWLLGLWKSAADIGLIGATDGLNLYDVGVFHMWPIMVMNANLPPAERVQIDNMILCGFIPGPKAPGDLDSFLWPLMQELKQLEQASRCVTCLRASAARETTSV